MHTFKFFASLLPPFLILSLSLSFSIELSVFSICLGFNTQFGDVSYSIDCSFTLSMVFFAI